MFQFFRNLFSKLFRKSTKPRIKHSDLPLMVGRRHMLTKLVAGVSAGVLAGVGTATGQERVVCRGVIGSFYAEGCEPKGPGKAPEPAVDPEVLERQQTERYEDLTAAEMVSMTVGIPLQLKEPHQASRIMQLSLDLEHFISVVPLDKTKVPKETLKEIKMLRTHLHDLSGIKVLLHLFNEIPGDAGNDSGSLKKKKDD